MNNQTQVKTENQDSKKEWVSPELKTFGTIAEITQTFKCQHGNHYPCPICTPCQCSKS